jgi:hypothetical protein
MCRKKAVYIGLGAICSFWNPMGSGNVPPIIKQDYSAWGYAYRNIYLIYIYLF